MHHCWQSDTLRIEPLGENDVAPFDALLSAQATTVGPDLLGPRALRGAAGPDTPHRMFSLRERLSDTWIGYASSQAVQGRDGTRYIDVLVLQDHWGSGHGRRATHFITWLALQDPDADEVVVYVPDRTSPLLRGFLTELGFQPVAGASAPVPWTLPRDRAGPMLAQAARYYSSCDETLTGRRKQ